MESQYLLIRRSYNYSWSPSIRIAAKRRATQLWLYFDMYSTTEYIAPSSGELDTAVDYTVHAFLVTTRTQEKIQETNVSTTDCLRKFNTTIVDKYDLCFMPQTATHSSHPAILNVIKPLFTHTTGVMLWKRWQQIIPWGISSQIKSIKIISTKWGQLHPSPWSYTRYDLRFPKPEFSAVVIWHQKRLK